MVQIISTRLSGFPIQVAVDAIYYQIITMGSQDEWIPHSLFSRRYVVLINDFELLNHMRITINVCPSLSSARTMY